MSPPQSTTDLHIIRQNVLKHATSVVTTWMAHTPSLYDSNDEVAADITDIAEKLEAWVLR